MKAIAGSSLVAVMLTGLAAGALAQEINLTLVLPGQAFWPGSPFWVRLDIENSGAQVADAQLFAALDVGTGDYWFYPSWCHYPPDLDWMNHNVPAGGSSWEIIPTTNWPSGTGSAQFLAAVLKDAGLISNVTVAAFTWSEEPPATPTPAPTPSLDFILVPGGTFTMGSPEGELCRNSNETQHAVTLAQSFHMLQTEVTQAHWVAIFGTNPSYFAGDLSRPVEQVTWFDCAIYCNRLSAAQGLKPAYYSDASLATPFDGTPPVTNGTVYWDQTAPGYRLPTESEWEYACRAGTTTAFNGGQDNTGCYADPILDPLAWYDYNSSSTTHAVGARQANSWTLYDLHGNAYEWCWDWYQYAYPPGPVTDPTGLDTGSRRVVRGGCWGNEAWFCRSAFRGIDEPGDRTRYIGFRIVRTGPGPVH